MLLKVNLRAILSLEKLTRDKTYANTSFEEINRHSLEVFAQKTFIGKYATKEPGDRWHRR